MLRIQLEPTPSLFNEIFFFAREDLYLVVCGGDPNNASSSYAGYILGFHAGLTPALEFAAHSDAPIVASFFSESTQELVTCDAKARIKLWSFRRAEGAKLRVYHRGTFEADLGTNEAVCSMTVVPELAICIVAAPSGKLAVVDLETFKAIDHYDCLQANPERINTHECKLSKLVFDADAQHLLIGFTDGTVDLFCFYHDESAPDARHMLLYMTSFSCHKGTVTDLCLIQGIEGALSCGADSLVRHWRPLTSAEIGRYQHVRRPAPASSQVPANTKLEAITTTRLVPLRLEVDAMCSKQLLMVIAGELITLLEVLTPCLPFADAPGEIQLANPVPGPSPPVAFDPQLKRWSLQPNRHHIVTFSRDASISILDAASGKVAFAFKLPARVQFAELEARTAAERALRASAAPSPRHVPRLRTPKSVNPGALASAVCYAWSSTLALHCIGWSDGKLDLRDSNADLKYELLDNSSLAAIASVVVLQVSGPEAENVERIEEAIAPSFGYKPLRPDSSPANLLIHCTENAELADLHRKLEASDKSNDPFLESFAKKPKHSRGKPATASAAMRRDKNQKALLDPLGARIAHILVSGNAEGHLHMWNVEAASMVRTVQAHSGPVQYVGCITPVQIDDRIQGLYAGFPATRCLYSAGQDGSVKLWTLPEMKLAGFVQTCTAASRPLSHGSAATSSSHGRPESSSATSSLQAPTQLSAMLVLPRHGLFVCGHDNGFVQVFPLPVTATQADDQTMNLAHAPTFSERAHTKRVSVLSSSLSDPGILLSASLDHGVMVWQLSPSDASLVQARRLTFAAPVSAACFTPICDEIVVTVGKSMSLVSFWDKDGAVTVSPENLSVLTSFEVGGKALVRNEATQDASLSEEPSVGDIDSSLARPGSRELVRPNTSQFMSSISKILDQMEEIDASLYPALMPVQLDVLRASFAKATVDDKISIAPLESLPEILSSLGWAGITWAHIQPVAARAQVPLDGPFLSIHETMAIADVFMGSPEADKLLGPIRARSAEQLLRRDAMAQKTVKKGAQTNSAARSRVSNAPRKYADMCATRTIITYNSLGEKSFPSVVNVADKISAPGRLHWDAHVKVDTHAPQALGNHKYRGVPGRELAALPQHFARLFASRYGERASQASRGSLRIRALPLISVTRGIRSVVAQKVMLDALAYDEGRPRVSMSRCVIEWHLHRFGKDAKMCKVVAERVLSFLNALRAYAASVLPCRTLLCFVLSGPHRRKPSSANFFVDIIQQLINRGVDYVPHLFTSRQDPPPPTDVLVAAIRAVIPRQHRLQHAVQLADDLCEAVALRPMFPQAEILEYLVNCYETWATFSPRRPSSPPPSLSEPGSPVSAASPVSPSSSPSPSSPVTPTTVQIEPPHGIVVRLLKPRPLRMLTSFTGITNDDHDHIGLLERRETIKNMAVPVAKALDDLPDMHWIATERPRYMSAPDITVESSNLPQRSSPTEKVDPYHFQTKDFGRRGKRSIFVNRTKRDKGVTSPKSPQSERRRSSVASPTGKSPKDRSPISPASIAATKTNKNTDVRYGRNSEGDLDKDDDGGTSIGGEGGDDDCEEDEDDDLKSYQSSVSVTSHDPAVWLQGGEDDEPLFVQEVPKPGDPPPAIVDPTTLSATSSGPGADPGLGSLELAALLSPGQAGGGSSPGGRRSSLFDQIMSPPQRAEEQSETQSEGVSTDTPSRTGESQLRRESRLSLNGQRRSSLLHGLEAEDDHDGSGYSLERPISRGATLSTAEIEMARRSFRASFSLEEQKAFELKRQLSHNALILKEIRKAEALMPAYQLKKREASARRIQAHARGYLIRKIVSSLAGPSVDETYLDSLSLAQSSNGPLGTETHVSIPVALDASNERGYSREEPVRSVHSRDGSPGGRRPPSPDAVRVLTSGKSSIDVNNFIFHAENDPQLLRGDSSAMDLVSGLLGSPNARAGGKDKQESPARLSNDNTEEEDDSAASASLSRRASRSLFGKKPASTASLASAGAEAAKSRAGASEAMKNALLAPRQPGSGSLLAGTADPSAPDGPAHEDASDAFNGVHSAMDSFEGADTDVAQDPLGGQMIHELEDGLQRNLAHAGNSGIQIGGRAVDDETIEASPPTPQLPPEPALSDELKELLRMNQYVPRDHKRSMFSDDGSSMLRSKSNCFGEEIHFDPLTLMKQVTSIPHWEPSENVDEDEEDWKAIDSLDMRRDQNVAQGNLDFLYADDDADNKQKHTSGAGEIHGVVGDDRWTRFFKEMEALLQPAPEVVEESELDRQERKLRELKRIVDAEGVADSGKACNSADSVGAVGNSSKNQSDFQKRAHQYWKQLQHMVKIGSAFRFQRKARLDDARQGNIQIRDLELGEHVTAVMEASKYLYFRFVLPSADSFLTVSIHSRDGDPDVFLSNEAVPTLKDYTWRTSAIGNRRIVLAPGEAKYRSGVYIAGIYSLTSASCSLVVEVQNSDYGCEELDHVSALTRKFNIIAVNPHQQSVEQVDARLADEALREEAAQAEERAGFELRASADDDSGNEEDDKEDATSEDCEKEESVGDENKKEDDGEAGESKSRTLERRATFPQRETRVSLKLQDEPGSGAMDDLFTTYENRKDDEFESKIVKAGRREVRRALLGDAADDEALFGPNNARASDRQAGLGKQDEECFLMPEQSTDSDTESVSTFGADSLVSEPVPHKKTRLLRHLLVMPKPVAYDLSKFHAEQVQANRQLLSNQLQALEPTSRCKAAFRGFKSHGSLQKAILEDGKQEASSKSVQAWLADLGVEGDGDPGLAKDFCRFEKIFLAIGARVVQTQRERMEERDESMRTKDERLLFRKSKSAVALGVGPRVGLDVAHLAVPRHPNLDELPNLAKLFAKSEKELDVAQRRANKRAVDHIRRKRREKILRDKLGEAAVATMQKMGGW
ncbi:Zinc finger CCCH domain-containing protein 62 [Hondaea fermentalgiana]|uniref:Zinc finger CCCH domain-containing protein 62 n=1 Tax=Hondaea fermentalgiana TaxID=2315210 RepID=A0A2R5GGS3_9STRA|nr:Zinc finger CCCH domain-containing protein 62 [Hondaea fermentalgiana]|eukprot:GBG27054.1 Zinc finger CCCH domain-containing protein 62 [Hondaea fermentalgiana]